MLESHIKELGHICLNFMKIREKKKESSSKLVHDAKIPRSLKLKNVS
jgi:hypothetical protein